MNGIEGLGTAIEGMARHATPSGPAPAANDVARLEEAMQAAAPPDPAVAAAEPIPVEAPAAVRDTPGDRILDGLSRMSRGYDATMQEVSRTLGSLEPGQTVNAADLLKLQFSVTQIGVQQEVAGKLAGRATQSLDQFLKNQ